MLRVFLTYHDVSFCKTLRAAFAADVDFEVCGAEENGIEAIEKVAKAHPDLVILELESGRKDDFYVADAIKLSFPKIPLFLVTDQQNVEAEKEAFSHGIQALFKKEPDLTSLLLNARATVGLA